ncbi:hypothetical protein pEaSNUABM37_00044 [Erwinia phage pEa_SNUABM_37]|nr:hypothetical protein pEaSNUABM37_00044 [Erwinia phage pEa_SNUABM_37]QXO10514.1 hypothetical protein pEaSNUABM48_00044 [Erwinia phage pEa_SNUABM_48]
MANNYLALVEHCTHLINNQPGGITWSRLLERVNSLNGASKREKTQVFTYLKKRPTIWNNNADDMSDTLFMAGTEVSASELAETNTTTVSAKATERKERLKKFEKINTDKTIKAVAHPTPTPARTVAKVTRMPTAKTGIIFGDNHLIDETDVIAEMAWHVYESGEHGMTISSLRMSVPEFSECSDPDRAYLLVQMRQRFGIGYYEKETIGDRVIKVLAKRTGSDYRINRGDWFVKMGRESFKRPDTNLVELRPQVATFGSVGGNSLADQLSKLNASELFNKNAGAVQDEFDEDEDDEGMEMDGKLDQNKMVKTILAADIPATMAHVTASKATDTITSVIKSDGKVEPLPPLAKPSRDFVRNWGNRRPQPEQAAVSVPAAKPGISGHSGFTEIPKDLLPKTFTQAHDETTAKPAVMPSVAPKAEPQATTVSQQDIAQTADVLRLVAAQLEAHTQTNTALQEKKARFDVLMRMARESSVQIQTALDSHNDLLDELQRAANDLTSL